MKDKHKHFGKSFGKDISFPKHLTPEIIHSALFVFNAQGKEEVAQRVQYCAKQIGDEAMSFAMALLVLPEQGARNCALFFFVSSINFALPYAKTTYLITA